MGVYGLGAAFGQSLLSLGAVLCLLALAEAFARGLWTRLGRGERVVTTLALAYVLFSVVNLLVRPFDDHTFHALRFLPNFLVPLLVFALPPTSEKFRTRMLQALAVTYVIVLGKCLFETLARGNPGTGFMSNPIYFAYTLLPAFVFFLRETARAPRLVTGVGLAAVFVGILLSQNRAVPFLALAALVWVALRQPRPVLRWGTLAAVLVMGGVGVGLYELQPRVRDKVARTLHPSSDPSVAWRLKAWTHNWNVFTGSPLTGVGAERNAIDADKTPEMQGHWEGGHRIYAHSIYLQALADSGLIGFLLLFGFLFALGAAVPPTRGVLLLSAVGGLTENVFNNSRPAHALFVFLLLTALFAAPLKEPRA